MSLSGSVQRKLQALQKIWQEDAKTNNGQKGFFLIEVLCPSAPLSDIVVQTQMKIPSWNSLKGLYNHP